MKPWGGNMDDPRSDAEKAAAFDPLSLHPRFLDNPYPTYKLLRELDPVHRCPDGSYFLTCYDDLSTVYKRSWNPTWWRLSNACSTRRKKKDSST